MHGGARYTGPTLVTPEVLPDLRDLIPLAPLHQPYNLAAIEAVVEAVAGCAAGRVLRHQLPSRAAGGRRSSCRCRARSAKAACSAMAFTASRTNTSRRFCRVAPEIADGRVIVAHLGSGASMCAMKRRKSIDSTLGFTALDGLCMGTRPGAIDPGVVLYLFQDLGSRRRKSRRFSTRSPGCSGFPASATTCAICSEQRTAGARLAVDYFVYRAAKEIGALAAVLGGVDALVFTAGIGENSAGDPPPDLRRVVVAGHRARSTRRTRRKAANLDATGSHVSAWVIPTNEELMIARHTGQCWDCRGAVSISRSRTMTSTECADSRDGRRSACLAGIPARALAEGNQRSRFHPAELRAVRRRRVVSRAGHRAHERRSGTS